MLLFYVVELTLEDYGNYTCEVRGPETTVLAAMTHYVYVRGKSINPKQTYIHIFWICDISIKSQCVEQKLI